MKILHVLAQKPGQTGSGVFLQQLFAIAHQKGYEQAVVAGIPKVQKESNIENLKSENFYPVYFESEELPFTVVGMSDVMPYASTKYSDMNEQMFRSYKKAFVSKITEAVESFCPDVVISNHLWLVSSFVKELFAELRVLCLCHGTDLRQAILAPTLFEIVQKNITKCDYVFALHDAQKRDIIQKYGFYPEQVLQGGTGYDPNVFYPNQSTKKPPIKIIYVGKMSYAKGVVQLLHAFESLNMPDVHLTLIGGGAGEESEKIHTLISHMGAKVRYLQPMEQRELATYFASGHIFVLPSFFEGLPLVVIEALACCMRVVCTALPGLREFLGTGLEEIGAIVYVDLPKMRGVDTPLESALPDFEQALKKSLQEQVYAQKNQGELDRDGVQNILKPMSWRGLFEELERYM